MKRPPIQLAFSILVLLSLFFSPFAGGARTAQAAVPTDLFFSEYIEGSSNNKALEIFNATGAAIDLASGGYNVQMFFNGNPSVGLTINLSGTVANGDVFILAHGSADAAILAQADQTNSAGWFNGDDAVVLRKGTTVLDAIGQIGFDPGSEWGTGLTSTSDNTLRRIQTVCAGDPNGSDAFSPALEWEGFANNTFGGLGAHTANCSAPDAAPEVDSTYPLDGATDFPISANLSVTFSEAVNVSDPWFTLVCSASGTLAATSAGGPTTFTLDPAVDLTHGESCTLTILAGSITDQDSNDPPDTMEVNFTVGFSPFDVCSASYTPIYAIQGSGANAAITTALTTKGVVVGDYEVPAGSGQIRGFYLQDLSGDGNPATSDGIFVFNSGNNSVNLGDVVRVSGKPAEYQGQTQIGNVTSIAACGTGSVEPVDVALPLAAVDSLEPYEGMLVRLPQTLFVSEHYQLGRFGQVVVSSGGRLPQPTNVALPGPEAQAIQDANNLNRLIIDDETNTQNPDPIRFGRNGQPLSAANTLRGGDTATGIVGVLNYTWGGHSNSPNAYRVRPVNALGGVVNFVEGNPRPSGAPTSNGSLRVAGMNLLNFFNTFSGCTTGVGGEPTDCRGASDAAEFERQWPKTVAAILGTQADVIGLVELENDGYGADSALQFLVERLNAAAGAGAFALIDVDNATGQTNALGLDAIKVGLIYKPASVTPLGTAALNSEAFVNGGDASARNRPALAQAFQQNSNGARLVVAVNHFKSKGSACDADEDEETDNGGQGLCNLVRVNAANELASWLASDPTGSGDADSLIIGDLNSYALEDPIRALESAGFTNMISAFNGLYAYSYVFDGQWGYLDHALASSNLAGQVTQTADWHINADEPSVLDYLFDFKSDTQKVSLYAPDEFRISDHDPVLVDLQLNGPPTVDAGGPYTVIEGLDVLVEALGSDPDGDLLSYEWDLDNDGSFETPGQQAVFSAAFLAAPGSHTIRARVTDPGGLSAVDEAVVNVIYNFNGFFSPVENLPAFNIVNSGQSVPVKFSLGGFKGMDIFAAANPMYEMVACSTGVLDNSVAPALNPGGSSLSYDPTTDQYNFVWKTQKAWKGTCMQLVILLNDGTTHRLNFNFNK